jgi:hypothetical protein
MARNAIVIDAKIGDQSLLGKWKPLPVVSKKSMNFSSSTDKARLRL